MKKEENNSMKGMPENYFDSFADKMMAGIKAANDLHSEPSLDYPKGMPYLVPAGYFDTTAPAFFDSLHQVQALDNEALWSRQMPYEVPAAYFEQIADHVQQRIDTAPIEEVDLSFIDHLRTATTYEVPAGYFEQFSVPIPSTAPVIAFEPKKKRKAQWMQWSAAACMLIIFGLGIMWMPTADTTITADQQAMQLASIQLENIPDAALDAYIDEAFDSYDVYASMTESNAQKAQHNIYNSLLNDVSDQDIDAYLEMEGI